MYAAIDRKEAFKTYRKQTLVIFFNDFYSMKNSMNNKNGTTQLSHFRFDECALHESSSVGYLGNNQSCLYDNFKETLPHLPALKFIFQGLESFVEYYSFFFSPLLLIFTRLVTWETLVLNWFCGIAGKGKLLIPF